MTFIQNIRDNFWFTVFCAATFVLLVTLGTWQVKRLQWKAALIEKVETNMAMEPIVMIGKDEWDISVVGGKIHREIEEFGTKPPQLSSEFEFRKVKLSGLLLHKQQIELIGKYHGKKVGTHIITPLQLETGQIVLVNRGWLPEDSELKTQSDSEPTMVEGLIMPPHRKPWRFLPQNQPEKNIWLWEDAEQMAGYIKNTGSLEVSPVLIRQTGPEDSSDAFPTILLSDKINIRNDHLEYAITWYSLALIIVVMYFIYIRRSK